jgi:hypothetical protein
MSDGGCAGITSWASAEPEATITVRLATTRFVSIDAFTIGQPTTLP